MNLTWIPLWAGWVDSAQIPLSNMPSTERRIEWLGFIPFIVLHLGCLLVFWVGLSPIAVSIAASLYFIRMFAITGFYHRYFSHRTFQTSRFMQFCFAVMGASTVQKGALWWAAHHREHHRHSDQAKDIHSPVRRGFWWSHIGWITNRHNLATDYSKISDLARFPELVFLNRFDWLVPLCFALGLLALGTLLSYFCPQWHTNGLQLFVWGFFISTVGLFHGTCSINSLSHQFGSQRYTTGDTSRNNFWLALLTLGEGWHNNHHYLPGAVRQGFYWWEVDITYYMLWLMAKFGLITDLNPVHVKAYALRNQRFRLESSVS